MSITLSPQNEELLKEVVSSGYYKSQEEALAEAIRLLREQSTNGASDESVILPPDQWIEEFDRITQSRKGGNPQMDDSRESIYGDRGR